MSTQQQNTATLWTWGTSSNKERFPGYIVFRTVNGGAEVLCSGLSAEDAKALAQRNNDLDAALAKEA